MHGRHFFIIIFFLMSVVSSSALAKKKSVEKESSTPNPIRNETREREARKACLEGDYARGVAMLSDLFLDFNDPTYIFNQGRCFQMNGRFKEAISRFREYLRTGGQDKAITEKHITECEDLVQVKPSPTASPEVKPVLPTRYQPPTIEGQQQPEFSVIQPLPTTSSRGSSLRMAGAVIAGLGVAGLALGIVLNLEANRQASSIEPPNHTFNRDTESTRTNYETSSWIGYGVGVIGLSTGAIFYFVGRRQDIAPRDVVLVPTLGPGLTGAGFRGAF